MTRLLKLFAVFLAIATFSMASVIYDNIPSPQPFNVPSLGYQANQTAEFGGEIQFAGTDRDLTSATVLMSNWAPQSESAGLGDATGYNYPLTLNIYNQGSGGAVGSLIGTRTVDAFIPWRPDADPSCAGGAWLASDGNCYNGLAFTATFDLTGITVPDSVIYGLAFNTTTWGYTPTNTAGPYESLNFGLSDTSPTVGTNPLPDSAYWNTETATDYADLGLGGTGTFRQDTGWTPYSGAISFSAITNATAVPEPATMGLTGAMLLGLGLLLRRRMSRMQT